MDRTQPTERVPRIGEIYNMRFEGTGSEQSGWRPGLVFQNNLGNEKSPNIIALPLTTAIKKRNMPTHVFLRASENGLRRNSLVLCENPERMSKEKVGAYITTLSDDEMREVATANLIATAAISFLDKESLLRTWEKAVRLNNPA